MYAEQFHATLCHLMLRCSTTRKRASRQAVRDLKGLHRLNVCQAISRKAARYLMLRCFT